jgi:hypothetical protein
MEPGTVEGVRSNALIATASASRYLQQICKHFAHKIPVRFDPQSGQIDFSSGICVLEADSFALRLSLVASDAEQLPQLEDVVARHLIRFAFREEMTIDWQRP